MKKLKVFISASIVGLVVLTSGNGALASNNDETKEVMRIGEYNYDTGEFRMYEAGSNSLSAKVDTDTEVGIQHHAPNAGGGTWYHDFVGIVTHWSNYDHKSLHHRASVQNSSFTVRGPWRTPTGGFSYAEIAQSLTGNKAFWATSNTPGLDQ